MIGLAETRHVLKVNKSCLSQSQQCVEKVYGTIETVFSPHGAGNTVPIKEVSVIILTVLLWSTYYTSIYAYRDTESEHEESPFSSFVREVMQKKIKKK